MSTEFAIKNTLVLNTFQAINTLFNISKIYFVPNIYFDNQLTKLMQTL